VFGTDSTSSNSAYLANVVSPSTVYPLAGTNATYDVYAGQCPGDAPPAGQQQPATINPGATTSVVVPEPAALVMVYTGTSASPGSLVSGKPVVTIKDSGCGNNEDYPPAQIPTSAQGALANPGLPYGNYTVCASYGGFYNTGTLANTTFGSPGNTVKIYLGSGASGRGSGVCT
jgi:hypothetical protein